MIKTINHVTVLVSDVDYAVNFFSTLGFKQKNAKVLTAEEVYEAMAIENTQGADHIALSLHPEQPDDFEIQLLHYRGVTPAANPPQIGQRSFKLGFDHIAFEVDNLDSTIAELTRAGIPFLSDSFVVNHKKLIFLKGPDGITLELAQLLPRD